jgi:hypothetical protein
MIPNYLAVHLLIGLLLVTSMGVWDYVRKRSFPKFVELILVICIVIIWWPVVILIILASWVKEKSGW